VTRLFRLAFLVVAALAIPCAVTGKTADPPILRSSSGQFILMEPANPSPAIPLQGLNGTSFNLAQYRGKVVVLNFWATWCLPCAAEMPSLDRLAAIEDPGRVSVIAVSIDQDGPIRVGPYLASRNLDHLAVALDPEQKLGSLGVNRSAPTALPLWGLPASFIISKSGRVVGFITGAVDWNSPRAKSFLDYFANWND
jgi:thiol-disulfide isomerase/thioredoxin